MLPEILLEYSCRSGDFGWSLETEERIQGRWRGGMGSWWRQYWWLDQKWVFPHGFFLSTLIETNEGEWRLIGNKAPEVVSYSSRCCDRKPGKASRGRLILVCSPVRQSGEVLGAGQDKQVASHRTPVVWKWNVMLAGVLFIQSRTSVQQIVFLTFGVGFPTPVNLVKVTPHRHDGTSSPGILDHAKLTVKL